jgi:hypothetical protein
MHGCFLTARQNLYGRENQPWAWLIQHLQLG